MTVLYTLHTRVISFSEVRVNLSSDIVSLCAFGFWSKGRIAVGRFGGARRDGSC